MQGKNIIDSLKKSGYRITKARKRIIEILADAKAPINASEIIRKLDVNKTTVYREIEALIKGEYIEEVNLDDGSKRYELTSRGHHHHLVCIECKSITELNEVDDLIREEKRIQTEQNFTILKHNLEFFGICSQCAI